MGVAQSATVTGTAMFPHKSLLFVCTLALATANPQSYFHNFGNQGTYTSVSHGSTAQVHQPAPAYKQPAPTCSILQTASIPCSCSSSSSSSSSHSKKLLPRTCSKTRCLPCPSTQTLCAPPPTPTILPPTTTLRPTTTSWSRY